MAGLTAIVCDDDPDSRGSACALLAAYGFEIAGEFDVAVAAVAVAAAVGPTLVVLGLSLPGTACLKAVPLLRDVAPGCEIVVCSTHPTALPAAQCGGVSEVIDKGDDVALEQVVRTIAERHRAPEAAAPG